MPCLFSEFVTTGSTSSGVPPEALQSDDQFISPTEVTPWSNEVDFLSASIVELADSSGCNYGDRFKISTTFTWVGKEAVMRLHLLLPWGCMW